MVEELYTPYLSYLKRLSTNPALFISTTAVRFDLDDLSEFRQDFGSLLKTIPKEFTTLAIPLERLPDSKRQCHHMICILVDTISSSVVLFDPQREKFNFLGAQMQFELQAHFGNIYRYEEGYGPRQHYSGDCVLATLYLLENIVNGLPISTKHSSMLVQNYKKKVCTYLSTLC